MKKLDRVFSGFLAAALVVTSLNVTSFAAGTFEFPEGFEDEAPISVSFDDPAVVPQGDDEAAAGDAAAVPEDETLLRVTAGGVADNAFNYSEDEDGLTDYEDRFDSTLDGTPDTYYIPNADDPNYTIMANVYQAPGYDIKLDSVSFFVGHNEYMRYDRSRAGSYSVYLLRDFGDDLAANLDSARRTYLGRASVSGSQWGGWVTADVKSYNISANSTYAVALVIDDYNSYEVQNAVAATEGSYGEGTSYVGYGSSNSADGWKLTDAAEDGMRAALNVHVSKYVQTTTSSPYVYIDGSCVSARPYLDEVGEVYVYNTVNILKSSPVLNWDKIKGASGYNIYRETMKNGQFDIAKIGSTAANVYTYTDSTVKTGVHRYSVTAVVNGVETPLDIYEGALCIFPSLKAPAISTKKVDYSGGLSGYSSYTTYTVQVDNTYNLDKVTIQEKCYDSSNKYLGTNNTYSELKGSDFLYTVSGRDFYIVADDGEEEYKRGYPASINATLWGVDGSGGIFCSYKSNELAVSNKSTATRPTAYSFTADSTSYRTKISVTPSADYTCYRLVRKESTQSYYSELKTFNTETNTAKTLTYIDDEVIPGKKYYYAVVAYASYNSSSDYENYILGSKVKAVTIPAASSPAKPSFSYAKDILNDKQTETEFQLIWNTVSGATSYKIYMAPLRSDNTKGSFKTYETTKNFFRSSVRYNKNYVGYFIYVVPSNSGKSINGAAASTYFKSRMTAPKDDDEPQNDFWISAKAGADRVTLTWYPQSGKDVRVFKYRNGDSMMKYVGVNVLNESTNYADTTMVDTDVEFGESYTYRAVITNDSQYDRGSLVEDTVSAKVAGKAKPVITSAVPVAGAVDLTWGAVSGATKYGVYSYYGGKYTALGVTTGTQYTAKKGLTPGVKYGFLVRAYVNGAWTSFTANDIVYATPAKFIAAPTIIKTGSYDKAVEITWEIVEGATRYAVYTYDYITDKYSLISNAYTTTTAKITGLTNGKRYGFLVRAYGNGTWSEIDEEKIEYASPRSDTPELNVGEYNGAVQIWWPEIADATKYSVYTYLNGKYTSYGFTADCQFKFVDLKPGVKYGFLVRSYINGKLSAFTSDDVVYYTTSSETVKPEINSVKASDKCAYVSWTMPEGATKNAVYTYDPATKKYALLSNNVLGTWYQISGLKNDKEIGILVRSYVNGAWTSFTADDISYVTPTKQHVKVRLNYSYYNYLNIYLNDSDQGAIKPTKYAIYTYRDQKFKQVATINANDYSTNYYLTDVVAGESLGILARAYIGGAWTDFSVDDVEYFDVPVANLYAYESDASGNKVLLTWNEAENATKYSVFTYDTETEKYTLKGTTEGTSLVITTDKSAYNMDSYSLNVLVRPYVNGAYAPYKPGSYTNVYVRSAYLYPNSAGIDNGIVIYNYKTNDFAQYRIYLKNKETGKYELKAETHGETVYLTGLTDGEYYTYVIYVYYNGAWINARSDSEFGLRAGLNLSYNVNEGSRQVNLYLYSEDYIDKYAVYTYKDGKYKLISNDASYGSFTISGLTNDEQIGVLVRAYINGKWSNFSEDDIRYVTPTLSKPNYYAYTTDTGVKIDIYGLTGRGYKKIFIYQYDKENDKYALLDTITLNDEYEIYYDVEGEDASSYGYLVRASDGVEMTKFTSSDIRYAY